MLLKYQPEVGIPVVDKTAATSYPYYIFECQSFSYNDEQVIAFSYNCVKEKKVLPYDLSLEKISWWATCRTQQIIIQNKYKNKSLQFNRIRVLNKISNRYGNNINNTSQYKFLCLEKAKVLLEKNCKDIVIKKNLDVLIRTVVFLLKWERFNSLKIICKGIYFHAKFNLLQNFKKNSIPFKTNLLTIYGMGNNAHEILKLLQDCKTEIQFIDKEPKEILIDNNCFCAISHKEYNYTDNEIVIISKNKYLKEMLCFLINEKKVPKDKILKYK